MVHLKKQRTTVVSRSFNGSSDCKENQINQRKLHWFVAIGCFSLKKWVAAVLTVWHTPYRKGDAADGQLWRSVFLFLAESLGLSMDRKEVGKGALIQAGKIISTKKKKKPPQKHHHMGCINSWSVSRQRLLQEWGPWYTYVILSYQQILLPSMRYYPYISTGMAAV